MLLCLPAVECVEHVHVEAAQPVEAPTVAADVAVKPSKQSCAECGGSVAVRGAAAGLCHFCQNLPHVRLRRGLPLIDFPGAAPLPPRPTGAPPGSEDKIVILELGFALWHPDDAPMDPEAAALEGVGGQAGLRRENGRIVNTRGIGFADQGAEDAALMGIAERWGALEM
jgi:hypothetical protein